MCFSTDRRATGVLQLDLATALRDVADVNRAFANPALGVSPRPGWRYRATLVYKPGLGQEAFFRALRLGPRLAAMMGTVCVDVEEARAASRASTVVEDASHGNEEAIDVTAFGVGSVVESSSDRTGGSRSPERDGGLGPRDTISSRRPLPSRHTG